MSEFPSPFRPESHHTGSGITIETGDAQVTLPPEAAKNLIFLILRYRFLRLLHLTKEIIIALATKRRH